MLAKLVESGPSLFVALVTLSLLEVSPRSMHLPFLIAAVKVWLNCYSDDSEFWVAHGIGRRACVLVEGVQSLEPAALDKNGGMRLELDHMPVEQLVRIAMSICLS